MRHWYVAQSQGDVELYRYLRKMMEERGYSLPEAASTIGISNNKARWLISMGLIRPSELKARRKEYIVKRMTSRYAFRHTPHVISRYFNVDESYVRQLIKELRNEGRLPPVDSEDEDRQDEILTALRRRFANVYRARVVGRKDNKVYVDGKGWLDWTQAENLAFGP